ncbi:hypothetical protein JCM10207_008453 [Rhodosporidiobolus poonsookiae]
MASPALGQPPPASHPPQADSDTSIRLPPVSLPPEHFLDAPTAFNAGRRQSIKSDPILHAASAGPPPALNGGDYSHHPPPPPLPPTFRRVSSDTPSALLVPQDGAGGMSGVVPASPGHPPGMGSMAQAVDGQHAFHFQPSFSSHSPQPPVPSPYNQPVGPAPSYRFGAPTQTSTPLDAPSYFDYSMRRHSLSNNINGTASPPRHVSIDNGIPSPGIKRKTSGDADDFHDGYVQPVRYGPPLVGAPPAPKRRTSSLTYDKLNNLSLTDHARRDSQLSATAPVSPWEEDRRGSAGSYGSVGSQSYGVPGYHPGHGGYEQHGQPQSHFQPHHQPGPSWDGQQIGPRGSISRGPYEDPAYARRPSIPSVSQMMQGQTAYYPAPPSHPVPSPHSQQPSYPNNSRGIGQPAVMVSSVPHTPTEMEDGHSRTASSASYSSIPPGGVATRPPPWGRPPPPMQLQRQNSASSLDPLSAFAPGQGPPSKDSPYARSPELRVSHKLAERKRRKEMAQLFEDLRDALPFERGLKASKWEILNKAIEYVAQIKTYATELQQENQRLREHYNHGPSSVPTPPVSGSPSGAFNMVAPGSSHSSQHTQPPSQRASPDPTSGSAHASPFPAEQSPSIHPRAPWTATAPSPAPSQSSRPSTAHPHPGSAVASPVLQTFPSHGQPPQNPFSPHALPHEVQPSPPLSQYAGSQPGANSPGLYHPDSAPVSSQSSPGAGLTAKVEPSSQ